MPYTRGLNLSGSPQACLGLRLWTSPPPFFVSISSVLPASLVLAGSVPVGLPMAFGFCDVVVGCDPSVGALGLLPPTTSQRSFCLTLRRDHLALPSGRVRRAIPRIRVFSLSVCL